MLERNVRHFFFGKAFPIDDFQLVIIEHSVCVREAAENLEGIIRRNDCVHAAYPLVGCKRSIHLHVHFSNLLHVIH